MFTKREKQIIVQELYGEEYSTGHCHEIDGYYYDANDIEILLDEYYYEQRHEPKEEYDDLYDLIKGN